MLRFSARRAPRRFAAVCAAGLLALCLTARPARAAEFNCTVGLDTRNLQRTDVAFLDELRDAMQRYFNERTWTNDRFDPVERIVCNVQVQFTASVSQTRFRANFTLTTRRPIFGSTQQTKVLQVADQAWEFDYVTGTQLVYDPQRYDAITSFLNYYAFLALGYDYDTFSALGGTRSFELARETVQVAQAAGQWQTTGDPQDRTLLIQQILDPRYRPLRQAYFDLHFAALDRFTDNPDAARQAALTSLRSVQTLYNDVSKAYVLEVLFNTKGQEIVDMMERSPSGAEAYTLLIAMDPARQVTYSRLVN